MLEIKQNNGYFLDEQQKAKLQTKSLLENTLAYLETGVEVESNKELETTCIKTNLVEGKSSMA